MKKSQLTIRHQYRIKLMIRGLNKLLDKALSEVTAPLCSGYIKRFEQHIEMLQGSSSSMTLRLAKHYWERYEKESVERAYQFERPNYYLGGETASEVDRQFM